MAQNDFVFCDNHLDRLSNRLTNTKLQQQQQNVQMYNDYGAEMWSAFVRWWPV